MSGTRLRRTQTRQFSAHHLLLQTAERAYDRAKLQQPGWLYDALTTMVFSALGIEALANAIGDRLVPDWEDFESSRPNAKLRILANAVGVSYDKTLDPWLHARALFTFRNMVAHAKPQNLVVEKIITEAQFNRSLFDRPQARVETAVTLANAGKALHCAKTILDLMCRKIPPDQAFGLYADGSFDTVSKVEESP